MPGSQAMDLCILGLQRPEVYEFRATWPAFVHPSGQ